MRSCHSVTASGGVGCARLKSGARLLERGFGLPGGYDRLIAGHARSKGLVIVTGNLREFTRVEGLRAEDWFA